MAETKKNKTKTASGKASPKSKKSASSSKVSPKSKATAKAKKKTEVKTASRASASIPVKAKKGRKNVNLARLCSEMNKMVKDAVDREVIKRFKIIIDTAEEDITKVSLQQLIKDTDDTDISSFSENFQAYIKHYIFMKKRDLKK